MKAHVFFVPHPPILLPEIGLGETLKAKTTTEAMHKIAKEISFLKPDTIIFISPHGNMFKDAVSLLFEEELSGDFGQFGHTDITVTKNVDKKLTKRIGDFLDVEKHKNIFLDNFMTDAYQVYLGIDHGALVPMHFIDQYYTNYNIVHITPAFTSLEDQYKIGTVIQKAIKSYDKRCVVVASGDLSHCLTETGPYSYHPSGPVFDELIVKSLTSASPLELIQLDADFVEEASQCGLRPFLIGFGIMDGLEKHSKVYSYEGPFGVGYVTAYIRTDRVHTPTLMDTIEDIKAENYEQIVQMEDNYIKLARKSIEHYVMTYEKLDIDTVEFPESFRKVMTERTGGVFVSIHKHGQLRGCIGTIHPVYDVISDEIIYNAIQACSKDPRFSAVSEDELEDLEIKVDILHSIEPIEDTELLEPSKYGVIVENGLRRGLLLPNLQGIDTVEKQVSIAMQKAGINEDETISLYRFQVERHELD